MFGVADPGQAETDLVGGTLTCPSCTGPLQPWGHARVRTVRDHDTTTLQLRPRRARMASAGWRCSLDPHLELGWPGAGVTALRAGMTSASSATSSGAEQATAIWAMVRSGPGRGEHPVLAL